MTRWRMGRFEVGLISLKCIHHYSHKWSLQLHLVNEHMVRRAFSSLICFSLFSSQ